VTGAAVVLDALALVAFIEDEPGAADVEVLLTRAGAGDPEFERLAASVQLQWLPRRG